MLGADTRSTSGSTVADKNCSKIHYITPNIYACGAGTAADLEHVTGGTKLGLAGGQTVVENTEFRFKPSSLGTDAVAQTWCPVSSRCTGTPPGAMRASSRP